jgi:F420H(2)-dependent quinone reductase
MRSSTGYRGAPGGPVQASPCSYPDHHRQQDRPEEEYPLLYVEDGEALVIVASNGGSDKAPSWFSNLKADPAATVQVGAEHRNVHAHVASPAERERLWPKALAAYRTYEEYQSKTEREIPVVILEPAT